MLEHSIEGTFAAPRCYLPSDRPEYEQVRKLFDRIKWPQAKSRKDFLENRFNAFCSILGALVSDKDWVVHTIQNKSHYDVSKWPVPYRAMKDVMKALVDLGWLAETGERRRHRNYRYIAPMHSPLRSVTTIKVRELPWEPPIVSIRRGGTDLERAPLDVEWMVNPKQKAWIAKHLIPTMEELNDSLRAHVFTLFPFGKPDDWVEPQYQRIYTNTSVFGEQPELLHGRIYPRNFRFPSKKEGWRQMTLIDGEATVEVDVHASSLTILSGDYNHGFDLPDCEDFYLYGPLGALDRDVTKKVIQAAINGVSLTRSGWPKSLAEDKDIGATVASSRWKDYSSAILEAYPTLADLPDHMGMRLMLTESAIIIRAMNTLLEKGIGCLSIHDCLIVPQSRRDAAVEAFNEAYDWQGLGRPKLKWAG